VPRAAAGQPSWSDDIVVFSRRRTRQGPGYDRERASDTRGGVAASWCSTSVSEAGAPSSVVEHLTFNQGVPGSIPGGPTNLDSHVKGWPPQPLPGEGGLSLSAREFRLAGQPERERINHVPIVQRPRTRPFQG
jgi:hypothetical protein